MGWQSLLARIRTKHARSSPYRGLGELDRKLEPWLPRRGYFVEAGANDGITQSNTYYFEKHRGWRGLLVEPMPHLAAQCRRNRPNATVINCALSAFSQDGSQVRMTYCNLMSLVHGSMGDAAADQKHVETGMQVQGIRDTYELDVPCRALGKILDELAAPQVDFLSLDVEGYEANVLRGLELPRQAPTFILVEARNEQVIRSLLDPHYEEVAKLSHHDILFRLRPR